MTIPAIIAALTPVVGDLIDRAFPDSEKRELARLEIYTKIQESLNQVDLGQMEVNKAEAANASMFVAGWRPFVGWVCGLAFAYHFIVQPFIMFVCALFDRAVILPAFDMDSLFSVLMGMLGLGAMRSWEKGKGVTMGLSGHLPWAGKK